MSHLTHQMQLSSHSSPAWREKTESPNERMANRMIKVETTMTNADPTRIRTTKTAKQPNNVIPTMVAGGDCSSSRKEGTILSDKTEGKEEPQSQRTCALFIQRDHTLGANALKMQTIQTVPTQAVEMTMEAVTTTPEKRIVTITPVITNRPTKIASKLNNQMIITASQVMISFVSTVQLTTTVASMTFKDSLQPKLNPTNKKTKK